MQTQNSLSIAPLSLKLGFAFKKVKLLPEVFTHRSKLLVSHLLYDYFLLFYVPELFFINFFRT